MAQSSIEWTEMTWNPTTGCDKISDGCKFCYAEVMSKRLKAMGQEKYRNGFKLTLHESELTRPYEWKKPKKVFVNSMSDLFHEKVPLSYIQKVFAVMNDTPKHTYQVLTKRADVLFEYHKKVKWSHNIWMGVSVENAKYIERIDYLRKTNAKTKFLSLEPLIGPLTNLNLKNINWVIVGGESGHGARQIKEEWILDIKKQCETAKVKFFFKQWGKKQFNINKKDPTIDAEHKNHAKGGCQLNGRLYRDMPERLSA